MLAKIFTCSCAVRAARFDVMDDDLGLEGRSLFCAVEIISFRAGDRSIGRSSRNLHLLGVCPSKLLTMGMAPSVQERRRPVRGAIGVVDFDFMVWKGGGRRDPNRQKRSESLVGEVAVDSSYPKILLLRTVRKKSAA